MDIKERVFENHALKKYCCSKTVLNLSLEDLGWDEERRDPLVKAMGAYCGGLHEGLACGALCGAKAVIFLVAEYEEAKETLGPEMMGWFKERYGSWNCADILDGDDSRKDTLCPLIMEDTYIKLRDMLEDIGAI